MPVVSTSLRVRFFRSYARSYSKASQRKGCVCIGYIACGKAMTHTRGRPFRAQLSVLDLGSAMRQIGRFRGFVHMKERKGLLITGYIRRVARSGKERRTRDQHVVEQKRLARSCVCSMWSHPKMNEQLEVFSSAYGPRQHYDATG